MRIGILGATGQVGSVLAAGISSIDGFQVIGYARSAERLQRLVRRIPSGDAVKCRDVASFGDEPLDAVVNCTGISEPRDFGPGARDLIEVTERYDAALLGFLAEQPEARAVSMSSGAVYDSEFMEPANASTPVRSAASAPVADGSAYGAVKAASEARHRAAAVDVVDLRLFGLFSEFASRDSTFLLSQALRSIESGRPLATDEVDVWRDVAHPADLVALVICSLRAERFDGALDVYSTAPASKFELLGALREGFGLEFVIEPGELVASQTGRKARYYSTNRRAALLGYEPAYSTLDGVMDVFAHILSERKEARS